MVSTSIKEDIRFLEYLKYKKCVLEKKTIIYRYVYTLTPTLTGVNVNSFTISNRLKTSQIVNFIDVNFSIRSISGGASTTGTINNITWNAYIIKFEKQIFFNTSDALLQTQKEIPIVSSGIMTIVDSSSSYDSKKGMYFPSENEQSIWNANELIKIEYVYKLDAVATFTLKSIVTYGILK